MISTEGSPQEWLDKSLNAWQGGYIQGFITIERFLNSRGFEIASLGNGGDTLIPRSNWTFEEAGAVFRAFHNSNTRRELLNYIEQGSVVQSESIREILEIQNVKCNQNAFGHTFEWYVSQGNRIKRGCHLMPT